MEILAVVLLTISAGILFSTEALRVDVVAILILVALALSGLVSPEQALSGFSNPATATVAAMFVISAALRKTGFVDGLAAALGLTVGKRPALLYMALLVVAAAVSAFINNTAAVAVFIPLVLGLCRSRGTSPGHFLMPLSFAAQVGGVCTLIGTSTNILVSDIAVRSGERPFGMFEFSGLGLWFMLTAMIYLSVGAPVILRKRVRVQREPLAERYEMSHYLGELEVPVDSRLVGKRLAEANLEKRLDIEVLEIIRAGRPLWFPDPEEILLGGDELLVRGPMKELLKARAMPDLKLRRDLEAGEAKLEGGDVVLVEATVPPGSPLVGRTLRETQFRRRCRVQALAMRHHDRLARTKVGDVVLSTGDVLLIQGRRADLDNLREGPHLILMEEVEPRLPSWRRALLALAVIGGIVAAAALGVAPILVAAMAGCGILVVGGFITVDQAYSAIDWKVIFLLAGVIPLGIALERTGAAALLAGLLTDTFGPLGPRFMLSAFYILATLLTQLMSNNATAALLAPLALASAIQLGVDPRPFLVALTFAASTSFMTPVGYQTNAMVMGPGGYRFADFARVGAPLNLIFWILATFLIPMFFPF
jgi:di/tricarboxylate transporter